MTDLPLFEGRRLKREGLAQVSHLRHEWLRTARDLALTLIDQHGEVTSDDLQDRVRLPEGWHPNLWGALFRDQRFTRTDFRPSKRPEAHARIVSVWKRA